MVLSVFLMILSIYSTVKQNCKAGIKLNLSEDGQYLEVTDVCDVHNHEVSKVYKFKLKSEFLELHVCCLPNRLFMIIYLANES